MYPQWSYFPRNQIAPAWVSDVVDATAAVKDLIDTRPVRPPESEALTSDVVLAHLHNGLSSLGFTVESGKKSAEKIHRPVLFGENGMPTVKYEVDAFHETTGIAVEVEAGRGAFGNADYRDIIRMSLMLDAKYMVLFQPLAYRTGTTTRGAYAATRDLLDAIHASRRLTLPFQGSLLVGY